MTEYDDEAERAAERGLLTAEARANVQRYRRVDSLMAMAAMLGGPQRR